MPHSVHNASEEEYLRGLVEAIAAAEEPVHHLQSVMLYLLFKDHARGQYDAVICGEGADRLFGNELHVFVHRYRRALAWMRHSGARKLSRALIDAFGISDQRARLLTAESGDRLASRDHLLWTLGAYGDTRLVDQQFGRGQGDWRAGREELIRSHAKRDLLDKITILSLLTDGCTSMSIWSKLAESQGIVVHYPFAMPAVVSYAMSLTWREKLREPKYFIRTLLRRHGVPESLIERPKLSFGFPYRHWALPGSLLQPVVDLAEEMFEPRLLRSLQSDEPGRAMLLWNLLNLFVWRKVMVEGVDPNLLAGDIVERHRFARRRAS